MEFKVYRAGQLMGRVELQKASAEWEPLDNSQDVKKGDILESVTDGTKLEVLENNPHPYLRPCLKLRITE